MTGYHLRPAASLGLSLLVLVVLLGGVLAPAAAGQAYYVATNGNNANPGTFDRPWNTIQKATSSLRPGDTVLIRGGVYVIGNKDSPITPPSGAPGRYITLKAYPGEIVTITGNYPTVGDDVWYGINVKGQSYIQVEGLAIRGFHAGVGCSAPGHHIVIKNNTFEYNSEAGVDASGKEFGTKEGCDYLTVVGNRIHHNGYYDNGQPATRRYEGWGSGVTINGGDNPFVLDVDYTHFHTVISNNIIYHNYDGTGGNQDNRADHTDGNGVILDHGGNFPPVLIASNLIFDNGGRCIVPFSTQNVWIVGNTCYKNNTDPRFIGPDTQAEIVGFAGGTRLKNIHIINNIAFAAGHTQILYFPDAAPPQLDIRNNLWFGQPWRETYSPYGTNYLRSDPQFVNPSSDPRTADFHLKAASPAINRGVSVPGLQPEDLDNVAGPREGGYDLGAYQYVGPARLGGLSAPANPAPSPK
jgi:hypothetical protein